MFKYFFFFVYIDLKIISFDHRILGCCCAANKCDFFYLTIITMRNGYVRISNECNKCVLILLSSRYKIDYKYRKMRELLKVMS